MGDMADMALSETMDMEDLRVEYRTGGISDSEAYDHGIIDELGFEARTWRNKHPSMRGSVKCRHCRAQLFWMHTPQGWRTSTNGVAHQCPAFRR